MPPTACSSLHSPCHRCAVGGHSISPPPCRPALPVRVAPRAPSALCRPPLLVLAPFGPGAFCSVSLVLGPPGAVRGGFGVAWVRVSLSPRRAHKG